MDLLDFSKLEDLRELEAFTPGFLLQVLQQFQVNFENSLSKTQSAMSVSSPRSPRTRAPAPALILCPLSSHASFPTTFHARPPSATQVTS